MSIAQDESPSKLSFVPNRELLDSSFEGYKLSLEAVPVYSSELNIEDIKPWPLSENQISFAHTKLSVDHNSNVIAVNPFSEQRDAFILGQSSIHAIFDRSQEQKRPETALVWSFTPPQNPSPERYNPSLCFAESHLAVYGDGHGTLILFCLSNSSSWKSTFKEEICGPKRPFVVLDALQVAPNELHVLLLFVDQSENVSNALVKEKSVSVVEWMSFELKNDGPWTLDRVRRTAFYGPLEKCCLSKDGKTFYFVTDKPFQTVFDSTLGEDLSCLEEEKEEVVIPTDEEINPAPFHWHQTVEDMTLWCLLPKGTTKRDIKVDFRPSFLTVSVKGEALLSGKLWNILESDSMSWTIKDRKLEINFSKVNEGMIWQRFLAEGPLDGDELADPNAIDIIQGVLTSRESKAAGGGTPFNMNELEDVDSAPDNSQYLFVVDGDSHKIVSRGDLGGRQWLFKGPESTFCIRHDVDGLVWKFEDAELSHVGTFSALGYVQASKQARKYTVFSPNHTFVAILDSSRHVYVYRQPSEIDSDLRNRKSGTRVKAIAKQSVITLDDTDEIIGTVASNHSVILCTHKRLICIKVR